MFAVGTPCKTKASALGYAYSFADGSVSIDDLGTAFDELMYEGVFEQNEDGTFSIAGRKDEAVSVAS
jgi:hypothetical protein